MPRILKPKRAGQPSALSGRAMTANLDAGSFDRITWLRHLSQRLLKAEAGTSVLIRRALACYQEHIERLLASHTQAELEGEALRLAGAAVGATEGLPEEDLTAVPMLPFSAIQEASSAVRAERLRTGVAVQLQSALRTWERRAPRVEP